MRTADTRRDRRGARAPAAIVLAAGASSRMGQAKALPAFARAMLTLLHALSTAPAPATGLDSARLADDLGPLLHGHGGLATRLSDAGLVKLFRLMRLARRLLDLEAGDSDHES